MGGTDAGGDDEVVSIDHSATGFNAGGTRQRVYVRDGDVHFVLVVGNDLDTLAGRESACDVFL